MPRAPLLEIVDLWVNASHVLDGLGVGTTFAGLEVSGLGFAAAVAGPADAERGDGLLLLIADMSLAELD